MKWQLLILLLLVVISIQFVSAEFGYNNLGVPQLPPEINYSLIDTNHSLTSDYSFNSGQLEGRDTATLVTYIQGLYDLIYCKLTGCTMTGDIDMGDKNITNADWLYARNVNVSEDLYVSNSSLHIGNVTISAVGNTLIIQNATVISDSFEGEGSGLYNLTINITNGTVWAEGVVADNFTGGNYTGDYFNGNYFCNYDGTNCSTISDLLQTNQIGAYEENITVTVSGGSGTAISSTIFDYLITQITVTPTSANNNYRFEAIEATSGDVIDRDRMPHTGTWDIYKSHSINDAVNLSITSASIDENFNVRIKYIDNYLP